MDDLEFSTEEALQQPTANACPPEEQQREVVTTTTTTRTNHVEEEPSLSNTSLAVARTTPKWAFWGIPILCIASHVLFAYGQIVPMWRLSLIAQDIDVWANATSTVSKGAFETLGWDTHYHLQVERNHTVQEFTYGFAIKDLYKAEGMPGLFLPRLAAILLVIFSGIWPHLKLMLLHSTWFSKMSNTKRRGRILMWLGNLGKWSLADVLTVCVMVGVLNLKWFIDPPYIKNGVMDHLPDLIRIVRSAYTDQDICRYFLHLPCGDPHASMNFKDKMRCFGCLTFVQEAYTHPEKVQTYGRSVVEGIEIGGSGEVRLAVVGMRGIYAFCLAVILSVLLSVIVDLYHHRDADFQRAMRILLNGHDDEEEDDHMITTTTAESNSIPTSVEDSGSDASEPLLALEEGQQQQSGPDGGGGVEPLDIDEGSVFSHFMARRRSNLATCQHCAHKAIHLLPLGALVVVGLAVYQPSMHRHVEGAFPMLLKDVLDITFEKTYSLETLKDTTGEAGGLDLLLLATFSIFCVVGPLLRGVLIVVLRALNYHAQETHNVSNDENESNNIRLRAKLSQTIVFLGAFGAWEVFFVAMLMTELLMPSITDTIIRTPLCDALTDNGSCLTVAFRRLPVFNCILVGCVLLAWLGLPTAEAKAYSHYMDNNPGMSYIAFQNDHPAAAAAAAVHHHNDDDNDDNGSVASSDSRQRLCALAAAMEEDARRAAESELAEMT
jgi:hypothetical protein